MYNILRFLMYISINVLIHKSTDTYAGSFKCIYTSEAKSLSLGLAVIVNCDSCYHNSRFIRVVLYYHRVNNMEGLYYTITIDPIILSCIK